MNAFQQNREDLIKLMDDKAVLVLDSGKAKHKTTDQFFPYIPNRNFFYLTGLNEENTRLMIVKGKEQTFTFLFIEETTEYMRQWLGEKISKKEASEVTGIDEKHIYYLEKFDTIFRSLMTYARGIGVKPPKKLFLDLYRINPNEPAVSLSQFDGVLKTYPELTVKNANKYISYLRMFKSKEEVDALREAIKITDIGLKRIMDSLKIRTNESQVEADFAHEILLQGSEGKSFNTISACGANGTVLHYEDNNAALRKEDLILCDLGALYKNYGSDITRTYPIKGKYNDRQKEIYEIVLKANKESIEFLKPGITWKELNEFSKDILASECVRIGLIKEKSEISKYYYHSIGHFLGLDVHDVGQYDLPLTEGMVITIEPGLYIKEEGIAVRIEDDILITKDGYENLSSQIIKEIKDIEKYMS